MRRRLRKESIEFTHEQSNIVQRQRTAAVEIEESYLIEGLGETLDDIEEENTGLGLGDCVILIRIRKSDDSCTESLALTWYTGTHKPCLDRTRCATPIPCRWVLIVTRLTSIDHTVATEQGTRTG